MLQFIVSKCSTEADRDLPTLVTLSSLLTCEEKLTEPQAAVLVSRSPPSTIEGPLHADTTLDLLTYHCSGTEADFSTLRVLSSLLNDGTEKKEGRAPIKPPSGKAIVSDAVMHEDIVAAAHSSTDTRQFLPIPAAAVNSSESCVTDQSDSGYCDAIDAEDDDHTAESAMLSMLPAVPTASSQVSNCKSSLRWLFGQCESSSTECPTLARLCRLLDDGDDAEVDTADEVLPPEQQESTEVISQEQMPACAAGVDVPFVIPVPILPSNDDWRGTHVVIPPPSFSSAVVRSHSAPEATQECTVTQAETSSPEPPVPVAAPVSVPRTPTPKMKTYKGKRGRYDQKRGKAARSASNTSDIDTDGSTSSSSSSDYKRTEGKPDARVSSKESSATRGGKRADYVQAAGVPPRPISQVLAGRINVLAVHGGDESSVITPCHASQRCPTPAHSGVYYSGTQASSPMSVMQFSRAGSSSSCLGLSGASQIERRLLKRRLRQVEAGDKRAGGWRHYEGVSQEYTEKSLKEENRGIVHCRSVFTERFMKDLYSRKSTPQRRSDPIQRRLAAVAAAAAAINNANTITNSVAGTTPQGNSTPMMHDAVKNKYRSLHGLPQPHSGDALPTKREERGERRRMSKREKSLRQQLEAAALWQYEPQRTPSLPSSSAFAVHRSLWSVGSRGPLAQPNTVALVKGMEGMTVVGTRVGITVYAPGTVPRSRSPSHQ